ncbi:hypothetical protein C7S14_7761 [Burkholderia cepacia]|nr:hypothetical protein C7S14_7761 [Burkholderia cepacia]
MRKRFTGRRAGIIGDAYRPSCKDLSPVSTMEHAFHTPSIDPMFSGTSSKH